MNNRPRIVADAHIWHADAAFGSLGRLQLCEHAEITPERLHDVDVLITRSSTRIDERLLARAPVRFVATATIGDDHVDKAYLQRRGIAFANAAGSSTGSVVEYVWAAMLELHASGRIRLPELCLGVIGAGRIGERLATMAERVGMRVLRCDPPRARREGEEGFHALDELLARADVLTLHTPLISDGPDRTLHLLDRDRLRRFSGYGVINAARGACVDNAALAEWLDADDGRFAVLDCWEGEPLPDARLLAHPGVFLATPHIAGHSVDGKAANTRVVHEALCRWLGIAPCWQPPLANEPAIIVRRPASADPWQDVHRIVCRLYPIRRDDRNMRAWARLPEPERRERFVRYRRHYPSRRAWHAVPVRWPAMSRDAMAIAATLGLSLVRE